jgi:4-oxalocrotonate tautomerase
MPLLCIKLNTAASQTTSQQVAHLLTELTHSLLKKRREVTAVQIDYVPRTQWFVGATVAKPTYSLDIKVTAGTNTKDEMQTYLAAVHAGMKTLLGDTLEDASYSILHEVRADSWGFGGLSQEFRYISGQAK